MKPELGVSLGAGYLQSQLGRVLAICLADLSQVRPNDPIEYIAHWLYKWVDAELYFYEKNAFVREVRLLVLGLHDEQVNKQKLVQKINDRIHQLKAIIREEARLRQRPVTSQCIRFDLSPFVPNNVPLLMSSGGLSKKWKYGGSEKTSKIDGKVMTRKFRLAVEDTARGHQIEKEDEKHRQKKAGKSGRKKDKSAQENLAAKRDSTYLPTDNAIDIFIDDQLATEMALNELSTLNKTMALLQHIKDTSNSRTEVLRDMRRYLESQDKELFGEMDVAPWLSKADEVTAEVEIEEDDRDVISSISKDSFTRRDRRRHSSRSERRSSRARRKSRTRRKSQRRGSQDSSSSWSDTSSMYSIRSGKSDSSRRRKHKSRRGSKSDPHRRSYDADFYDSDQDLRYSHRKLYGRDRKAYGPDRKSYDARNRSSIRLRGTAKQPGKLEAMTCTWGLEDPRVLVCKHPLLGVLRSRHPQTLPAVGSPMHWASNDFLCQVFYDHEIYTVCEQPDDDHIYADLMIEWKAGDFITGLRYRPRRETKSREGPSDTVPPTE